MSAKTPSEMLDEIIKGKKTEKTEERRTYTWRGPYHRYVDFKIVTCTPGIPEDDIKSLEEDLKDPNSDIRRDVRERFELDPPREYELGILMPPHKYLGVTAGCIIRFRKVR